ncbi:hypothetical protein [Nocardiopsis akebiae]|uniref:hypothetical protein n=1 Tax=Nocardiopsis akebiae TaxID=2831968 RepID=UPI0020161A87|nr:hypothetical protein [Nocardiopsis akebiae]
MPAPMRGLDRYVRAEGPRPDQVPCFTVVLDPLWRVTAADRARDLCGGYGFGHRVLHPEDIASLLGVSASPRALWREVRSTYGADASHVDCSMPVWDVPEVLPDSCYRRVSEVNYSERIDSTAPRRSSIYYQAHALDAIVPRMSLSLMTGVRDLSWTP